MDLTSVAVTPQIPDDVVHWHGKATGSHWAMLPGRRGPCLVEAASREQLAVVIHWHLRRVTD
ncbi:hypothetical protein E1281_16220 [Actinomadura sp. KC345]|uniref:hypothetical protein n=1 Tax=Actinomadura sp. KC345 TaxID=2530371 RepID=UPI00104C211B|nr:hypothetical protein [Actinomadura sp. KC345]TDC54463.1 hypothetical protein E1281_16220 [Actinomadura sp. KC345]